MRIFPYDIAEAQVTEVSASHADMDSHFNAFWSGVHLPRGKENRLFGGRHHFRYRHLADMPTGHDDVRSRGRPEVVGRPAK